MHQQMRSESPPSVIKSPHSPSGRARNRRKFIVNTSHFIFTWPRALTSNTLHLAEPKKHERNGSGHVLLTPAPPPATKKWDTVVHHHLIGLATCARAMASISAAGLGGIWLPPTLQASHSMPLCAKSVTKPSTQPPVVNALKPSLVDRDLRPPPKRNASALQLFHLR